MRVGVVRRVNLVRAVGLVCALSAAVFWAVDLTLWQHLAEWPGEFGDVYGENNTYWAREMRFMAVVAVALGLVLTAGGERRARWAATGLGVVWIAADLMLDRADVEGRAAATWLAVVAGLVVAAVGLSLWGWLRRAGDASPVGGGRAGDASPVGGGRPGDASPVGGGRASGGAGPGRRALILSAAIAGALVPLAAGIESPTDTEPMLTPAAVWLASTLALLAVGLALAAAPRITPGRLTSAAAVALFAAGDIALARSVAPGTAVLPLLALGGVVLAGVGLISGSWPGGRPPWLRQGVVTIAAFVLYPLLVLTFLLLTAFYLQVGAWFTALAGNVAINSADTDTLVALIGSLSGFTFGWLLIAADRMPDMGAAAAHSRLNAPA